MKQGLNPEHAIKLHMMQQRAKNIEPADHRAMTNLRLVTSASPVAVAFGSIPKPDAK